MMCETTFLGTKSVSFDSIFLTAYVGYKSKLWNWNKALVIYCWDNTGIVNVFIGLLQLSYMLGVVSMFPWSWHKTKNCYFILIITINNNPNTFLFRRKLMKSYFLFQQNIFSFSEYNLFFSAAENFKAI